MIAEERLPTLGWRTSPPGHILGHAGLTDLDAKLEQLAMDSRRSPQRVGEAHLADQPANFQRHRWSAAAMSRFPAPIQSETRGAIYNSVRLNDRKRTTGLSEQPVKTNENQSVNWVESELARRPSPKHIDLLPQDQNLGLKRSSRPEKIREHPPDQSAQVQHHATASPDSQSTTSRIWFAVGTGIERAIESARRQVRRMCCG